MFFLLSNLQRNSKFRYSNPREENERVRVAEISEN